MKKILFTLVALLVGLSASAGTIYCVGSGKVNGMDLPSSPNGACVAVSSTKPNGNVYEFEVSDCSWLKISDTNASGWDDNGNFNGNGFCVQDKGEYKIQESELGKNLPAIWYGYSNHIDPPSSSKTYVYKLTVGDKNNNNTTLVVTEGSLNGNTGGDTNGPWYLQGQFTSSGWADNELSTKNSDGTYSTTLKVTVPEGLFIIRQGSNNYFKAADKNTTLTTDSPVKLLNSNNENCNYKLGTGNYTFTWNPTTNVISVSGNGSTGGNTGGSGVFMVFNSDNDAQKPEFEFTKLNDNVYHLMKEFAPGSYKFKIYQGQNRGAKYETSKAINGNDESYIYMVDEGYEGGDYITLNVSGQSKMLCIYFYKEWYNDKDKCSRFEIKGAYPVVTSYPEVMYLYGHIQGGSWDHGNLAELTQDADNPGVYYNNRVYIKGQWNQHDVNIDGSRTIRTSTGGKNYVAFYTAEQTKGFDYKDSGAWKFGSVYCENNIDNDKNNDWNNMVSKDVEYTYGYQTEREKNNFVVKDGYYKVVFDKNKGTVLFTDPIDNDINDKKIPVRYYTWCYGDDEDYSESDVNHIKAQNGVYSHTFQLGDSKKDIIQVALEGNSLHDAARQAVFEIKKIPAQNGRDAKRLAVNNPEAYTEDAVEGVDYSIINDINDESATAKEKFENNTLIQLLNAGEYYITATLHDDAVDGLGNSAKPLSESFDVRPSSLYATVLAADLGAVVSNTKKVPFNPQSKTYSEDGFISFAQSVTYGTDYTITVSPDKSKGGAWVSLEDYDSSNIPGSYQEALNVAGSTLYKQWSDLGGVDATLDGFFTSASAKATNNGASTSANVEFTIPCSGVYTVTVNGMGNYAGYTASGTYTVYPNLYGQFGTTGHQDMGYNVAGFTFEPLDGDTDVPTIIFPQEAVDFWKKIDAKANPPYGALTRVSSFIPGTYFVDQLVDETAYPENSGTPSMAKRNAGPSPAPTAENYVLPVDLRSLDADSSAQMTLSIFVSKNGASYEYPFYIKVGDADDSHNSTTGVEAIGADVDGEAVYFNLQGVQVKNPEHGIYVKVQNGKATKVVL